MRTTEIAIGGERYPLCYSSSVDLAVTERFDGLTGLGAAIDGDDRKAKVEALTWALEQMLEGGRRYMALMGNPDPRALPSPVEMRDLLSLPDMMTAVIGCIKAGSEREIDVEPPKKRGAAGGA